MRLCLTGKTVLVLALLASCVSAHAQLTLPYHGTASKEYPLFWMTQNGLGNAGRFEIGSVSNTKGALVGISRGTGYGVYGLTYLGGEGIHGESRAAAGIGVYGKNAVSGNYAYLGGPTDAVHAVAMSSGGRGIYGEANSGTAACGVVGHSTFGDGVFGWSALGTGVNGTHGQSGNYAYLGRLTDAVYAKAVSSNGDGIHAVANNGTSAYGVYGESTNGRGVYGTSATGDGVYGTSTSGYGVYGSSAAGYGVYGWSVSGWAGYFDGNAHVSGALEKAGGGFKIDHPLDPQDKYLSHSFVESPDMKNVYDGVAVLDSAGEAWVLLPDWFEALNRDFRYQLTCIGGFAPVYIADEVSGNQFKIAGGNPGMKVSWQVTGIRQDAWADANRIQVEQDKPENERGYYQNPEAFGQPMEMGITSLKSPRGKLR